MNPLEALAAYRITVDADPAGHRATCARCGWQGRAYSVPDTAYKAAKAHTCKGTT